MYRLYVTQTKTVTILEVRPNPQPLVPGTLITANVVQSKTVLARDLPPNPVSASSLGKVYAAAYLYPGDALVQSKVTDKSLTYKKEDERIIAVKPLDGGLMGLIQPEDRVTLILGDVSINDCRVLGTVDGNGNILRIIPQLSKQDLTVPNVASSILPNQPQQQQANSQAAASWILIAVPKDTAATISKTAKVGVNVIFERRPSIETEVAK